MFVTHAQRQLKGRETVFPVILYVNVVFEQQVYDVTLSTVYRSAKRSFENSAFRIDVLSRLQQYLHPLKIPFETSFVQSGPIDPTDRIFVEARRKHILEVCRDIAYCCESLWITLTSYFPSVLLGKGDVIAQLRVCFILSKRSFKEISHPVRLFFHLTLGCRIRT